MARNKPRPACLNFRLAIAGHIDHSDTRFNLAVLIDTEGFTGLLPRRFIKLLLHEITERPYARA